MQYLTSVLLANDQLNRNDGAQGPPGPFGFAPACALLACLATLGAPSTVRAQDGQYKVAIQPRASRPSAALNTRRPEAIRLDVNVVLIPVLVTDLYDRPVHGLKKEDFRLFEDGTEQTIAEIFSDDSPVSIGVVFDCSNSMRAKLGQTRQAVSQFLRMSTPGDEFFLIKFSDHPELVQGFTSDIAAIEEASDSIQARGWTSLYDAMYLAINRMKRASRERKVLLVLSDGADNNSRYSEGEVRQLVKEADVRIFSISILDRAPSLERLSEESGGRAYRVKNLEELPEMTANISVEMHMQYVLGYTPMVRQNDGRYRKVRVEVIQPAEGARLRTSWKRGYYGPAQ